jgi:VCBS repeat-containing protein
MLTVNPNVIGGDSTTGTIDWSFSSGSETFDYLAAGESLVLTYTITVTDSSGATDTQNVTITINGTNDAPVVTLTGNDSAAETLVEGDGGLATDGTLTVTDLDRSNAVTAAVSSVATTGTTAGLGSDDAALLAMLTVNPNVIGDDSTQGTIHWHFDSGSETFRYLALGESLTLAYMVTVTDSAGASYPQLVTITIEGVNNAPTITTASGGPVEVQLQHANVPLLANGAWTITDPDGSNSVTAAVTALTISGTTIGLPLTPVELLALVTVNNSIIASGETVGTLNWTFNSVGTEFAYLAEGETLTLTYTITVTDSEGASVSELVSITITGANEKPTINDPAVISIGGSDSAAATLIETNSGLTASGSLTVTDPNQSDIVTAHIQTLTVTGTTAGLSSDHQALFQMLTVNELVIDSTMTTGSINWSFDSGSQSFDYLAEGEMLVLTYTVRVQDSIGAATQQPITITIVGTNDAPVVVSIIPAKQSVDSQSISLDVSPFFVDVDASDQLTFTANNGLPPGLTLDSLTGLITGQLDSSASAAAPYQIEITATDPQGASVSQSFQWTVDNVPPTATDIQAEARTDEPVTIDLLATAISPDGDTLRVSHIDGQAVTFGQPISLSSGAILTVASDGTAIYDARRIPTGRFNNLAGSFPFAFTITDADGDQVTAVANVDVTLAYAFDSNFQPLRQAQTKILSSARLQQPREVMLISSQLERIPGQLTIEGTSQPGAELQVTVLDRFERQVASAKARANKQGAWSANVNGNQDTQDGRVVIEHLATDTVDAGDLKVLSLSKPSIKLLKADQVDGSRPLVMSSLLANSVSGGLAAAAIQNRNPLRLK